MFCTQCGTQLPEGAMFCHQCGSRVGGEPQAFQAAPPQPEAPRQNPQPSQTRTIPSRKTVKYIANIPAVYAKGEITVEQNFLKLKVPNIALSFIPIGAKNDSIPVNQIASVTQDFSLSAKNIVLGFLECFIGACVVPSPFAILGVLLLLVGICTIINAFQTTLDVCTVSGRSYKIPFLIFDKSNCEKAEKLVNNIIGGRLNDTNFRQTTEMQTNALVGALQPTRLASADSYCA